MAVGGEFSLDIRVEFTMDGIRSSGSRNWGRNGVSSKSSGGVNVRTGRHAWLNPKSNVT
jgi:hypothetical protein